MKVSTQLCYKRSRTVRMCSGEHGLLMAAQVWSPSCVSVFSRHSSARDKGLSADWWAVAAGIPVVLVMRRERG